MAHALNLLIVEDSEDDALLLLRELQKSGFEPDWERVDTPEAMMSALAGRQWDVVVSDFSMPHFSGLGALQMVKESGIDLPFIIVSGKIGEETAVEAMRSGAHDYIIKGNLSRLAPAIEREMNEAVVRQQRRQAEEELRKAKVEWERTFDAIVDPVMILDTSFKIVKANKAMADKMGVTPAETAGMSCCNAVHGRNSPPPNCPHVQMLADGHPHSVEIFEPCFGGSFEIVDSPLRNADGRLCGSVHYARDINARKLADDALKKEKEFLGNLLQGSAIATFVLDPQHRVLLWNHACEALTGVKAADVIGTSLHWRAFYTFERPCLADIVIEGSTEQLQQLYRHASQSTLTAEGLQAEARYHDLNGSDRYILFNAAPIRNSNGMLLGAIETLQDISEQKTIEAQLFQAQKMEAIGQLAGGIAHDFNNILTVIIGFSTIIKMEMAEDDPQKANLNNVLAAADRAADLTRSLLTFSRKQEMNPQPVDLTQTIRKIDKFLKRIIGEDIELKTSFSQDAVTVYADTGQIEQVLVNLAANARDAMSHSGVLAIETGTVEADYNYIKAFGGEEPGWYACISVSDSGMGMDEATCKRVFEPFFTTKEVGKGTGLGLSIVFGIIKQHNGFIKVYSEPGKGTTFRILLPLIQSTVTVKHTDVEDVLENGVETLLVADDDASIRALTEKAFTMFGYTVITAANGNEALARFKENKDRIALVVLDIIMPEKNGKEVFDEMKKINPAVRGIFISGYTSDIIQKRGLIDQGLEFVAKPLNLKHLLIKVREVLDAEA
jgi:PAS domain S-box-containing protein